MKLSNYAFGLLISLSFLLMFTSDMYAQNSRGRNDRDRRYGSYYGSGPRVSVGIGYNPYHHFRPVYRPRIYYRPAYRLPYRYVHYGPAIGIRINILPFGYNRFFIGNDPFYYYQGVYYRPYKTGGYVVTQPPLGAMVKNLPSGAKVTMIDGQKYFTLGGTFYQERIIANNKLRYEVVGTDGVLNTTNTDEDDSTGEKADLPVKEGKNDPPPAVNGSTIDTLPGGCTAIVINQQKYYISPTGVYYQEVINGNNIVSYQEAGTAASGIDEGGTGAGSE